MSDSYLMSIPVNATENLNTGSINDGSGHQYKAVDVDGTIAADAGAIGILQNKPKSGEDATVGFMGRSRYVAGAAVAAGARITVTTSGYMITCTSGSAPLGRAIGAVGSGGIGEAIINFAGGNTLII